jgi:type II secretory pathway predicted ATPase ExeA
VRALESVGARFQGCHGTSGSRRAAILNTGSSVVYQEFFGFDRRPFPTHGAASPLIPTPATDEALPALERCAREGRGIAILSAPAGTGKTAVAVEVGRRLSETLHVVYLSSSNYTSRRGLLQAILFELGVAYAGLSEEEARLQVIEFARGLLPDREGIALLVDEADQLSGELLEELRTLAGYMHEGRPLLRLTLCGQLGLDERLAAPEMDAFNQHVGSQVVLETLDRKQSGDYVRATLDACGADPEEVFSAEALDLICAASDGNVRCLHHLCDHALLLAFVAEEKPVSETTVRAALEDLQGLPLAWQVPAAGVQSEPPAEVDVDPVPQTTEAVDQDGPSGEAASAEEPAGDDQAPTQEAPAADQAETTVIEFGGDVPHETCAAQPVETEPVAEAPVTDDMESTGDVPVSREYRLEDRYAELDRLAEAERRDATPNNVPAALDAALFAGGSAEKMPVPDATPERSVEGDLLAEIAEMRAEVRHVSSYDDAADEPVPPAQSDDLPSAVTNDEAEWDVIQPELEGDDLSPITENVGNGESGNDREAVEEGPAVTVTPPIEEAPAEQVREPDSEPEREQNSWERIDPDDGTRRYAFLFTRLRNRRRDLAARSGR